MMSAFDLPDVVTGTSDEVLARNIDECSTADYSWSQRAARINSVLREIHSVLLNDEDVSKKVVFSVKERGENDRNRLAKLFLFEGPDPDTKTILQENLDSWRSDPASIWTQPVPAALGSLQAEAGIVGCYIQTKRGDA